MKYTWDSFTERSRIAVQSATDEANRLGNLEVGPDDLIHGLLSEPGNVACRLLDRMGVKLSVLSRKLHRTPSGAKTSAEAISHEVDAAIRFAYTEAFFRGDAYIGTEHLLLGLMHAGRGKGIEYLHSLGADPMRTRAVLKKAIEDSKDHV